MNFKKHPMYYSFIGFIAGIILVISGYGLAGVSTTNTATITTTAPKDNSLPLNDIQRFTTAISEIKSYYVNSVTDEQLFEAAIRGMVSSLDPHSDYLNESDYKELTSLTTGEFGGLGLEVTLFQGVIKVITPIDDTPAFNAGIKPGDLIISLDNTPTDGMSLKDAVEKMRGKKGTIVNLVVIREGLKKPLTFHIVRDEIHIKSVKSKMLETGYGYIRLNQFQTDSADDLGNAVKKLQTEADGNLKGLIIDLRNNPGGLLNSAVAISDLFLDSNKLGKNKLIVYTKGRVPDAQMSENATPGDLLNGAPIVILINGGSASAAEILAGALQDHNRAVLVGSKSFGKGSVQTVLPLDNTTGIKITTALYFTPNGRSIQALGIKPDIQINDVKVIKPKNDFNTINYSESNLTGHLNNAEEKNITTNAKTTVTNPSLIYDDYTLYEGLNILKTMSVLKNSAPETASIQNTKE